MHLTHSRCSGTLEDEQDEVMEKLSDTLHALYVQSNARNFLLMDVPPMDRCPGGARSVSFLHQSLFY